MLCPDKFTIILLTLMVQLAGLVCPETRSNITPGLKYVYGRLWDSLNFWNSMNKYNTLPVVKALIPGNCSSALVTRCISAAQVMNNSPENNVGISFKTVFKLPMSYKSMYYEIILLVALNPNINGHTSGNHFVFRGFQSISWLFAIYCKIYLLLAKFEHFSKKEK